MDTGFFPVVPPFCCSIRLLTSKAVNVFLKLKDDVKYWCAILQVVSYLILVNLKMEIFDQTDWFNNWHKIDAKYVHPVYEQNYIMCNKLDYSRTSFVASSKHFEKIINSVPIKNKLLFI